MPNVNRTIALRSRLSGRREHSQSNLRTNFSKPFTFCFFKVGARVCVLGAPPTLSLENRNRSFVEQGVVLAAA
jgi:hypothetical protein